MSRNLPQDLYTDDNLYHVRMATRLWVEHVATLPLMEPVLDIGPLRAGGVFERMPDTWFDLRALVRPKAYFTMDLQLPCDIQADITNLPMAYRGVFGTIFCLHVLEHVRQPFLAAANLVRLLRPGGRAYVLTPWALRLHGPRPDCWRISDDGLRALFANPDAEIETVEKIGDGLNPVGFRAVVRRKTLQASRASLATSTRSLSEVLM